MTFPISKVTIQISGGVNKMKITILVSQKIDKVRHRSGSEPLIEVPSSKEPYKAKFTEERGKNGSKFLALYKNHPGYGMTVKEWRQRGAEVNFPWWWVFGWSFRPKKPSDPNQRNQKPNQKIK